MKRYTPITWADVAEDGTPCGGFRMHPLPDGEWASYDDAQAEIRSLKRDLEIAKEERNRSRVVARREAQAEIDRLRAEIDRIVTGVRCFAYDHEADPVDCLLKIKRFLALPNAKDQAAP